MEEWMEAELSDVADSKGWMTGLRACVWWLFYAFRLGCGCAGVCVGLVLARVLACCG